MTELHTTRRARAARNAQAGACNPIPLCRALHEGVAELREANEATDTADILNDPALRLLVHQLAHLFRANDDQLGEGNTYSELMAAIDPAWGKETPDA